MPTITTNKNKMAAYLDILKEVMDGNEWRYYKDLVPPRNLDNSDECKRFIIQFVKQSGKGDMSFLKNYEKEGGNRIRHIVSVFFFGCWIYQHSDFIKNSIDKDLGKFNPNLLDSQIENKKFYFIWFLIVMFHDVAHYNERVKKEQITEADKKLISELFKGQEKELKIKGNGTYSEDVITKYANYRGKVEHGIFGGVNLFNELPKIRAKKEETDHNRCWKIGLNDIYHEVAYIIACHNIWFANPFYGHAKQIKEYTQHNLKSLFLNTVYQVPPNQDPILFLLLLADSIEPIKHRMQKALEVELNGHLIIRLHKCNKKYDEKLQSLAEWLCPVEIKRNVNSVEYSIHFKN